MKISLELEALVDKYKAKIKEEGCSVVFSQNIEVYNF